jgi:hypothetical protein
LLALPAFAQASGEDVIRDCQDDGHVDGNYSQSEYQDAQDNMPSDVDQYSDCRDVIAQAQAGGTGSKGSKGGNSNSGGGSTSSGGGGSTGSGGGSSSGSGSTPTDSRRGGSPKPYAGNPALQTKSGAYAPNQGDKAAYDAARAQAARGGSLPGGLAIPAAGEFRPASPNALPLPVVLALAAVGLLVLATSVLVARKRLPALNRVAGRFRRS